MSRPILTDWVPEIAAGSSFGFADLSTAAPPASATAGGWSSQKTYPRLLGDVTGDGKADVVAFANDGVYVLDATLALLGPST